jgi:DNA processing protein
MHLQQQIALTLLNGTGRKRIRQILAHTESVETFFKEPLLNLLQIPGINARMLTRLNREQALKDAEAYVSYFEKETFRTHFFQSADFPTRLNNCEDGPLLLFSQGEMEFNAPRIVAIVGTRKASAYGKKLCEELISSFAGKNIVVVSGLAYGIDVCVHQLCIEHGVQTIGVLGHGLDRMYPAVHRKIARKMLENGGLLTEFLPGTSFDRMNFPMRNRIVAGMCDATIVIESGEKGGSLITAELANDYNRDVFAFPGDVTREFSIGCHSLIQQNRAHLITGSPDFFRTMNWDEKPAPPAVQHILFNDLSSEELSLVQLLQERGDMSLDVIALKSQSMISKVSALLLDLEFRGVVRSLPGKQYQLVG